MENEIYVIKIGSNVLIKDGGLDKKNLNNIANQIIKLKEKGVKILIISSGAVALGKNILGSEIVKGLSNNEYSQFYSSIGQPALMNLYSNIFKKNNFIISQALLTRKDFIDRNRYLSMKKVLLSTLENSIIPILNENDVLSKEEYNFTDNDELAALVAAMIGANKLIILSNIDGLYDKYPNGNLQKNITEIDDKIMKMASKEKSKLGKGGIQSKLNTAKLVMNLGIKMYLTNGKKGNNLLKIFSGKNPGTIFESVSNKKIDSLKKWLKAGAIPTGKIIVSNVISDLLKSGKKSSLLEIGVEKIEKHFIKGDVVDVCDEMINTIGYGIAKINSSEIKKDLLNETKIVIHTDYFINI